MSTEWQALETLCLDYTKQDKFIRVSYYNWKTYKRPKTGSCQLHGPRSFSRTFRL